MEGEEEMISDFIPDVRVDVPMPRCRQPKPDYSHKYQHSTAILCFLLANLGIIKLMIETVMM